MTYIEGGPTTGWEKAMYWVLGIIFVAFLISIPFMARDQEKRQAQAWHDQGCQMYDDYKPENIPAKCSTYFIDQYMPQEARKQPPDER